MNESRQPMAITRKNDGEAGGPKSGEREQQCCFKELTHGTLLIGRNVNNVLDRRKDHEDNEEGWPGFLTE